MQKDEICQHFQTTVENRKYSTSGFENFPKRAPSSV